MLSGGQHYPYRALTYCKVETWWPTYCVLLGYGTSRIRCCPLHLHAPALTSSSFNTLARLKAHGHIFSPSQAGAGPKGHQRKSDLRPPRQTGGPTCRPLYRSQEQLEDASALRMHSYYFGNSNGGFQKSGALIWTQNRRALVISTPTQRTPIYRNSPILSKDP